MRTVAIKGAGPADALQTTLAAYYAFDEASGDAVDARGRNLTAHNAPGSTAGKLAGCRTFNGTNQYFGRADAALHVGGQDWTIAGWVWADSVAGDPVLWTLDDGGSGREMIVQIEFGFLKVLGFRNTNEAAVSASVIATPPQLGVWYFFAGQFDATTFTLYASVNAGTQVTAALGGPIISGTEPLEAGRYTPAPGSNYLSGRLDAWGLWKSVPGGGGRLTAAQLAALYNGGAGLAFPFGGRPLALSASYRPAKALQGEG